MRDGFTINEVQQHIREETNGRMVATSKQLAQYLKTFPLEKKPERTAFNNVVRYYKKSL